MPLTRAEIEAARARLGLTGGVQRAEFGFERAPSTLSSPASAPSGGGGGFGFLGDALGVAGDVFGFFDEPLSNRLGVNLPGPLDFLLEEATRPTTLAIALGGAGLAPRVAGLGFRGSGLLANVIAPAGGAGFGSRLAAETAVGLGARGAGEAIQHALPENTPAPARIALGLGAGALGGGAAFGLTRAGVRSALGRDILTPLPTLRPTAVEVGERKGRFLNVRTADQLPADYDVSDVLKVAREAENTGRGAAEILTSRSEYILRQLGETTQDATGNYVVPGIRRKSGTGPAYLQEVLEFGDSRFDLSPQQNAAVARFQDIYTGTEGSLRAERAIFGIDPEEADLLDGQRFISRSIAKEPGRVAGGGGKKLKGIREHTRTYKDPKMAIDAGYVYEHPAQALDQYTRRTFDAAANEHVAELLRAVGERPLDRVDEEIGGRVRQLRQQLAGRRQTRIAQEARLGVLDDEAARRARESIQASEREFIRADTLNTLRHEAVSPGDIAEYRRLASTTVTDAQRLARSVGRSRAIARELQLKQSAAERELGREAQAVRKLANELNELLAGRDEGLWEVRALGDRGQEVRLGSALREERALSGQRVRTQRDILRRITTLERRMARLSERSASLDERVQAELLKGATADDIGKQARIQIEEALRGERQALRTNQRIRAAELELRAAKADARRSVRRQEAATGRAVRTAERLGRTEESIEALEARLEDVRASWERAKEEAARIPEGRARVDMSVAPKLIGVDFPEADAQRIADWYARGKPPASPQTRNILGSVRAANRFLVPLRATADASATFNQLAVLAVNKPKLFLTNFGKAIQDAIDFAAYDRYLDDVAEDAARHQVAILGRGRVATTDFEFDDWFTRNPVLSKILGPAQRHFQAFTTRMRVDTYNALRDTHIARGEPLDDLALDQVGRALNRITGISTSRAGDVETLLEFAPNFFRSTAEVFWTAGTDGSIEGQLARQYMRNLVAMASMVSVGVAVAQGRDVQEVTNPLSMPSLKRGEVRLNPNFLTVRIPGLDQDVSLLGRFDSFARLGVLALDTGRGVLSEQSVAPLVEAIDFVARTKGAPTVSAGLSALSGRTFTGAPFPSAEGLVAEFAPFSFSSLVEDASLGPAVALGGAATNSLGLKSNPITPFERLQEGAAVMFDKPIDQLTGAEREELERAFPTLAAQFRKQNEGFARQGDTKAQARIRIEAIDQDRLAKEAAIVTAFTAGDLSRQAFGDAIDEAQQEAAIRKREARETLGVEFADSTVGAAQALSAWYDTFSEAEIPGTGVTDWERRDELEAQLFRVIDAGDYGDPALARRAIEERRRPLHEEPLVQQYFDNKDVVGGTGYYDVRDNAFARLSVPIRRIAPEVSSYGALLKAINRAELEGDTLRANRLKALQGNIDRIVSQQRLRMRLTDPALDQALLSLGRVSVPARRRA